MTEPTRASADGKLFGRYNDVVLLVIGFVLTTVVGGALTYWYQQLGAQEIRNEQRRQAALYNANAVFNEMSKLMDHRMFESRQLIYAVSNKNKAAHKVAMGSYDQVLREWNENLNRNRATIQINFGCSARQYYDTSILAPFSHLNDAIKDYDHSDLSTARKYVKLLADNANAFDTDMLALIKVEHVGALRQKIVNKDGVARDEDVYCR